MAQPNPRIPSIPAGWIGSRSSTKGLQLVPAEMFNRSFAPSPDATLHVAPLKRPPIALVIAAAVITVFCGLIVGGVLAQAGRTPSMQGPAPYVIAALFGLLGLFFLFSFVNAIAAIRSRGSWSNRQCIALGRSGIAIRLQGVAVDVPWDDVTAVRALFSSDTGMRRTRVGEIPVLRVERGLEHWQLATSVLDAAPAVVYTALHYYWTHPTERSELGTTFAQQRMDLQAGLVPQTIAPGVTRFIG